MLINSELVRIEDEQNYFYCLYEETEEYHGTEYLAQGYDTGILQMQVNHTLP
jgi:hypothetical protein